MLVIDKTAEKDYFSRFQRPISCIFFVLLQLAFHGPILVLIYTLLTFDLHFLLWMAAVMLLQLPVRRSQRYIDFINKCVQPLKYFRHFQIIHEEQIKEADRCLFGVHPHSVFGLSLLSLLNSQPTGPLSNLIGLSSRFILNFPLTGLFLKLWGFQAVNPPNLRRLMRKGRNVGMLPGGFEEATVTSSEEMRCWVENRKGFVKYALEHGYTIYPVLMMNEHKAYSTFQPLLAFRLFLNKLKIPAVLFWNKWTGLLLPPSLSLHLIVGRGIRLHLPPGQHVTQQMLEDTHRAYVAEIMRVYEKYAHLNDHSPIKIY